MKASQVATIRPLGRQDAASYRALRIAALEAEPEAFSADLEEVRRRDLAWFERRLDVQAPSAHFGAFLDENLVGLASLSVESSAKQRHRGLVTGVFVAQEARGRGLAARLLGGVIAYASKHVDVLDLAVGTDNAPARALYGRLGFRPYGVMHDALRVDGRSIDEELMALDLRARD